MSVSMRKRACYALVMLLSTIAGLFFGACYLGRHGSPAHNPLASVAEAKPLPVKKELPSMQRMLGAQVAVFRSRDYGEVEQCIINLKTAGVNTVIVRAFQNPGDRVYSFARPQRETGVYFQTSHAPVVDPVLARIVSIGHRHGLNVFAWMETRHMPLDLPDPESSRARRYCFETGSLQQMDKWSIFDDAVEKGLLGLYKDVVNSGIDGILFQDDLVMHQNEDFSSEAVALFKKETGIRLNPEDLYSGVFQDEEGRWLVSRYSDTFWLWARWKNQKLLNLARKLIQAAKVADPDTEIAMNFVYETVTDPKNALAWLSQDLVEAAKLPIDYYAVMAYHRQMRRELQLSQTAVYDTISTMTATLLKLFDDPHKILMKVQMSDWDIQKQIPSVEADEIFQRINSQGRVSLAFFPYSPEMPLHVIEHHFQ